MEKHFLNAIPWTFLSLTLCATGCSDDDGFPVMDGKSPEVSLVTDHIETGAGHRFTIEGDLSDADGIASIRLECSDLYLDKTIDLLEIYGDSLLTKYHLSYYYDLSRDEIGERFTVKVTVTDVGGRSVSQDVLVTMDGDFAPPTFTTAPDAEVTVLVKVETKYRLSFTASDDRALDYVSVTIADAAGGFVDGFDSLRVEAGGRATLQYSEQVILPGEAGKDYKVTLKAVDEKGNETLTTSTITVSEMPDFPKMYLADVSTAEELNSDVFGVPMVIEHTGEYQYKANYYCEKAGTEIFFLPQKTDFSPICFGIDPENGSALTDDPETAKPIVLDKAGLYYEITFNVKESTYSLRTYSVDEAIDPVPHEYGSISLDTWMDGGSWLQEFYFGYMTDNPKNVKRFTQDAANPHLYRLDEPLFLEAGSYMSFIIQNWHSDGWWNYCSWRADDSKNPEIMAYYGDVCNPEWREKVEPKNWVGDNWVQPDVNVTGNYKLTFDAHLGRAKVVPAE